MTSKGATAPRPFFLSPGEHFIIMLGDQDWAGETLHGRPVVLDEFPGRRRDELDEMMLVDTMRRIRTTRCHNCGVEITVAAARGCGRCGHEVCEGCDKQHGGNR